MDTPHVLVAGANGIVGFRVAQHMHGELHWPVVGLGRSAPPPGAQFRHVTVDLTSAHDCRSKLGGLDPDVIVYAARFDHPGTPAEPIDRNLAMLAHLLDAVEPRAGRLRHVHLVHGTKYYGAPYGRYRTPAREDDPRHAIDNFYYAQQDFMVERQQGRAWTWSISRPQAVSDACAHVIRSVPWAIAAYAVLCKAKGIPLSFPGSEASYRAIYQCTDGDLLARAIAWMCTQPRCANQAFNVTNGDYFRWENLWPRIATWFGVPLGPVRPMSLAKVMPGYAALWSPIAREHGLANTDGAAVADWSYLDFALAPTWDRMSDLNKLRRFGFHECVDSEEMFLKFFERYCRQKMIPDPMNEAR